MMKRLKHRWMAALGSVAVLSTLLGCDPFYHVNVYLQNSTSQTIVFRAVQDDSASVFYGRGMDSIVLKSGEKIFLFEEGSTGFFDREDVRYYMEFNYPSGVRIDFENGDSILYSPQNYTEDFHSPYHYKSYFYHERSDEDNDATYVVLY